MNDTFTHILETVAEYDVEVAKGQFIFEKQTGLKLDKMTEFLMRFIYSEDLKDRTVTITILTNTTMSNENTIRTKLKHLVKHDLIEISKCGSDGRTKKILPTQFLKEVMVVDVVSKLKTVESISENFKEAFGGMFAEFYKEVGLESYKAFNEYESYDFYKTAYKKGQQMFRNTLKKLG
jgi:hypothetical protein|tara:strand:+ start:72 stop:605 length:534 start_codon:yes stop_codon:yes gene_type:complete